jgi:hypothetical protein
MRTECVNVVFINQWTADGLWDRVLIYVNSAWRWRCLPLQDWWTTYITHVGFLYGSTALSGLRASYCRGLTITLRHTTLGRTPLDEWSARSRDLYLTTQNYQKRQTSMPGAGFELAIPANEQPQTHTLYPARTGIGTRENAHTNSVYVYMYRP